MQEELASYLNNISHEEIDKLKTVSFNGRIAVISHIRDIPDAISVIRKYSAAGFDTETKPSFKKGRINKVAMIQLAIPGQVFIFRINKTGLTRDLIEFFEDKNILKIGVSIQDDLKKLRALSAFNPAGFLELQKYSSSFLIESNSLQKLAAIVLGIRISKSQRLTNWESSQLTDPQLNYAATDAWVCLEVYNRLNHNHTNKGKASIPNR